MEMSKAEVGSIVGDRELGGAQCLPSPGIVRWNWWAGHKFYL